MWLHECVRVCVSCVFFFFEWLFIFPLFLYALVTIRQWVCVRVFIVQWSSDWRWWWRSWMFRKLKRRQCTTDPVYTSHQQLAVIHPSIYPSFFAVVCCCCTCWTTTTALCAKIPTLFYCVDFRVFRRHHRCRRRLCKKEWMNMSLSKIKKIIRIILCKVNSVCCGKWKQEKV